MTSIERGPGLSNVILGVASAAIILIMAMFGFWEVHQEAVRADDRQQLQNQMNMLGQTINHVYELEQTQALQIATLQEIARRDLERERNRQ